MTTVKTYNHMQKKMSYTMRQSAKKWQVNAFNEHILSFFLIYMTFKFYYMYMYYIKKN